MKNFTTKTIATLILAAGVSSSATIQAADFYIDPINGQDSNDGSYQAPWKSLKTVIKSNLIETQSWDKLPYNNNAELVIKNPDAPIKSGDTIWLMSGNYGDIYISSYYNKDPITLQALPGHNPVFSSMRLQSVANWNLDGLIFNPETPQKNSTDSLITTTYTPPINLLQIESHGWRGPAKDITVQNSTFKSAKSIVNWSIEDWNNLVSTGIDANGSRIIIRNNKIMNIKNGIITKGSYALVENNEIVNFAGDGIRGLGNYSTYQYNLIKNNYAVNSNHDDAFQSWSYDNMTTAGTVKGVTLRGNTIINSEDENQPFKGPLQGIGCFNGIFEGWTIENNIIMIDDWHGITLYGAKDTKVMNNTVVDIDTTTWTSPRITIKSGKAGMSENLIRNNISHELNVDDDNKTIADHNLIQRRLDTSMFIDFEEKNLNLAPYSIAIDAGSNSYTALTDADKKARKYGDRVDIGALEFVTNY